MSKYRLAGLSKRRWNYADAQAWPESKAFLTKRKYLCLKAGKNPHNDPAKARLLFKLIGSSDNFE